jgi:hypothetical protein
MWEMRQHVPVMGRISGQSQVYLQQIREEKDTRFQHDSRENGHKNDARSIPYTDKMIVLLCCKSCLCQVAAPETGLAWPGMSSDPRVYE